MEKRSSVMRRYACRGRRCLHLTLAFEKKLVPRSCFKHANNKQLKNIKCFELNHLLFELKLKLVSTE